MSNGKEKGTMHQRGVEGVKTKIGRKGTSMVEDVMSVESYRNRKITGNIGQKQFG